MAVCNINGFLREDLWPLVVVLQLFAVIQLSTLHITQHTGRYRPPDWPLREALDILTLTSTAIGCRCRHLRMD